MSWNLRPSEFTKHVQNPILRYNQELRVRPSDSAPLPYINLTVGDPTVTSDLCKPTAQAAHAMATCLESKEHDGYKASRGTEKARASVARFYSRPGFSYAAEDIVLTNGCSQALDLCIMTLASAGDNVLIPNPSYLLYKVLCNSVGINVKPYKLMEDKNFEIDLQDLEAQIDQRTVALIVNNPSNPCGSVYSKEHLADILALANKYKLPIIADEVYGEMIFEDIEFHYMSQVNTEALVLSCNSLSKSLCMPGWRFGWIAIHDPRGHFDKEMRQALLDMTMRTYQNPNSLIQAAVCELLDSMAHDDTYLKNLRHIISENVNVIHAKLAHLKALKLLEAKGGMFMLARLDKNLLVNVKDDLEFAANLIQEQGVYCLPMSILDYPDCIRITITVKRDLLEVACERIAAFVSKYSRTE